MTDHTAALRQLIAQDSHAATFQTLGQYRRALLDVLDSVAQPQQQPAQGQDAKEPERFVVLKASGSRYAYVNDTLLGKTVKRYDVLRQGGWINAELHAARLNRDAAMTAAQDAAQGGGKNG